MLIIIVIKTISEPHCRLCDRADETAEHIMKEYFSLNTQSSSKYPRKAYPDHPKGRTLKNILSFFKEMSNKLGKVVMNLPQPSY